MSVSIWIAVAATLTAGPIFPIPLPPKPPPTERGPEPRILARPSPRPPAGLDRALADQGYVAVPLKRGPDGHFDVARVTIGGEVFRLALDTGSPSTCLDRDRTARLKLDWRHSGPPAAENALFDMTAWCDLPALTVGGFVGHGVRSYRYVAAYWNARATAAGDRVDGLLGTDVLNSAGAVIDLPGRTLYVRKAEVELARFRHISYRHFVFSVGVDPRDAGAVDRVRVFVSDDRGESWRHDRDYAPGGGEVNFKAPRDGEYWFAVQIRWNDGRAEPMNLDDLAPNQKVVVDTAANLTRPLAEGATRRPTDLLKEIDRLQRRVAELEAAVNK